jgi:hypothetical protein
VAPVTKMVLMFFVLSQLFNFAPILSFGELKVNSNLALVKNAL